MPISFMYDKIDVILFSCIAMVLKSLSWEEFQTFPYQVALVLLLSIVTPLFTSAVVTAHKRPLVVLSAQQAKQFQENKNQNRLEIGFLKVMIVFLFPFIPAIVVISGENAKKKMKALKSKGYKREDLTKATVVEEFKYLKRHIDETRLALLSFKRNELSMELIIQQSITLIMILLSKTDFPVESGLQSIFLDNSDSNITTPSLVLESMGLQDVIQKFEMDINATLLFLVFSIIWSFRTCVLTSIKIKAKTKKFLPFFSIIILGIRYFFIFGIRVGAIVAYFSPFLGLLGIMNHYEAETIPLDPDTWKGFNDSDDGHYHYWNPMDQEYYSIHISQLFRSDYEEYPPKPPSSTNYTVVDLGTAYLLFWSLYLIYAIILSLFKYWISPDFKASSKSEKFQHIIEALNNPDAFNDWDSNLELDVKGHLRMWTKVLFEMIVMSLMQMVTNLIMLVPFWITALRVKDRHNLLLEAIGGVFDEEEYAYHLVKELSWILPAVILCGGLVDLILIVLYMKFAHPWKGILSEDKTSKTDVELDEEGQVTVEISACDDKDHSSEAKVELEDQNQDQLNSTLDQIRSAYYKNQVGNKHYLLLHLVPIALYQAKERAARKASQIQLRPKPTVLETRIDLHDHEEVSITSLTNQECKIDAKDTLDAFETQC